MPNGTGTAIKELIHFPQKNYVRAVHTVNVLLLMLLIVTVPAARVNADTITPAQGEPFHQPPRTIGLVGNIQSSNASLTERVPHFSVGAGPGMALLEDPDVVDSIPSHRFSSAPVMGIKIGYAITRYFGVELGYDQYFGLVSHGAWTYRELPYGNLKINMPFHDQALFFILGASNARWSMGQGNSSTAGKVLYGSSSITTNDLSAHGLAIDFGAGYETYLSTHWSWGGELLYRYFVSVVSGYINGGTSYSSPRPLDLNNLGLNLYAEYHFAL